MGQSACIDASAGHFVAASGAVAQTPCAIGSYQPNSGQSSCTLAAIGFFVPNTTAIAQTACATGFSSTQGASACSGLLNIDFSDAPDLYAPMIDGTMLVRYLRGTRGAALTQNATGTNPLRDAALVEAFIAGNLARYDVDADGQTLAESDGVLILRYLLGFRGSALTAGANLGTLTDSQIEERIQALTP